MFKSPFSFEGRIRRTEYGITLIIYVFAYILVMAVIEAGGGIGALVGLLIIVPLVWFLWAQGAKRCHDVDKSGWWQLIPLFPLILLFLDGHPGTNEYGSNPKGVPGTDEHIQTETLDGHLRS